MTTKIPLPQTAPLYQCPQCRTPVRASDKTCPACGVNLALAAVLAERQTLVNRPADTLPPLADLPRFGEFLVRQGYLSPNQLQAGLTRQREAATLGVTKTIGQVLLEMGVVTRDQSDTGQGISPEQLGHIFQPFHQVPAEAGQVVDGTGLGLALVKRIVEAHESKVEVISRPKQGSTFAFDLSMATPPPP